VIEDESRVALRSELNKRRWVLRDYTPDYGVDGQVEVFEAGRATGLTFFVQLKATDSKQEPLAVRFSDDIGEYYRSLDHPLLVVRFHATTHTLYARWFHSFDPFYGQGRRGGKTFRFSPTDKWTADTPGHLLADIHAYKRFRAPELELPLTFYVTAPEGEAHGAPVAAHVLALRAAASGLQGTLRFVEGSPPGGRPRSRSIPIKPLSTLQASRALRIIIRGHGYASDWPTMS
jgi:hypothetical protein